MFIAALFPIDRIQKQPKCPATEEWKKIVSLAETQADLETIIQSEVGKSEREKQYPYDITYMIWGWGGREKEVNWEIGIDIYTLPYIK